MLSPAYETLRRVRAGLPSETTLLGFAGAPWTLATYMAAGRGGDEQKAAKLWGYRDPKGFEASARCRRRVRCGSSDTADRGGRGCGADFRQLGFGVARCAIPALGDRANPRRSSRRYAQSIPKHGSSDFRARRPCRAMKIYARETGVDVISLDTAVPMTWAAEKFRVALQGNLDPIALIAGGDALAEAVDEILDATQRCSVHLQSGARNSSRDADRTCRAADRAGAGTGVKLAVVLFNLGGPDRPEAVEPFLRNLFTDPAIISLPGDSAHALGALHRQAPGTCRTRDLRQDRWPFADRGGNAGPGARPGAGPCRRGASKPKRLSPCAAGTRSAMARRRR